MLDKVQIGLHYFPFGMAMPSRNLEGDYRYAYQGQEKDPETGKEAFELRLWDSRIGRWLTTDPKREFDSPYLGMGNNPLNLIDPDGGSTTSTGVIRNDDGTYNVVAGEDDGNDDVYLATEISPGEYTYDINSSFKIGTSYTLNSFLTNAGNPVIGAQISLSSDEGQRFLTDEIIIGDPAFGDYLANGYGGRKYDLKTRGENERPAGVSTLQWKYRGSVGSNGKIGSARDFGNIAAVLIAARAGLSWKDARRGFDGLEIIQGVKNLHFKLEGPTTQKAQYVGYQLGLDLRRLNLYFRQ